MCVCVHEVSGVKGATHLLSVARHSNKENMARSEARSQTNSYFEASSLLPGWAGYTTAPRAAGGAAFAAN